MPRGWSGLKLETANKLLMPYGIEIKENPVERNYYAIKYRFNNVEPLRRASITELFAAVMEYWFAPRTESEISQLLASSEPRLLISAELFPNQTN